MSRSLAAEPHWRLRSYVIKRLPPGYSGARHLVTVGKPPDGRHQWEERPGPPPIGEGSDRLLVEFVRAPVTGKVDETTPGNSQLIYT